ncbi:tigger transposable element-derived 6-like [Paramuricea clavata]|uniref:Tigger transposable element-derived 6-like n=1 Tax=Paramuricea clavata TaxID=317549 RepID=A0A7D9LKU2_PARCT|nr:tigger transposable element-derived 6-like [Paramuricea clavata]
MDQVFYGLSINDIRALVYEYCEKNNISNNFNSDKKMAGRDFVKGFLKRHPKLSLRKPESISLNRVFGLNRTSVNRYFGNLKTVVDKHNFKAHEIFNCDESGLTCVHKPNKVLAPKEKRTVSSTTSGERGQTTTIVVACSASGVYVPPMMIFKRKRNKPELVDHAPAGTIAGCSDSGWIEANLFLDYIKHFAAHVKCSKGSPVLLILDGHKSHTKCLSTIEFARENGIEMVSLPPHTSHKLQPLDRSFFKPLKSAFNTACSSWLRSHSGRRITVDKLGELFNTAYLKAATMENAISGFRCSGIVPFNSDILPSSDFLEHPHTAASASEVELVHSTPGESVPSIPGESLPSATVLVCSTPAQPLITSTPVKSFPLGVSVSVGVSVTAGELSPSTSGSQDPEKSVTLMDILKVPLLVEKQKSKRSEESEHLTGSPYKQALQRENVEKEVKLAEKKRRSQGHSAGKKPKKAKTAATKPKKKVKASTEDAECPICGELWSVSKPGEDWVTCIECKLWCHEECCTITPTSATCDLCV